LPIGCAISFMMVQWVVYGQSLMAEINRGFVNWMIALIVVQSLFSREGFLHRFGTAALVNGLLLLPYMVFNYSPSSVTDVQRVGLEHDVGWANPNQLAGWFGFCCVYWAIVSIETRRKIVRVAAASIATGCLFIVGLTVSRTALGAVAIAVIIAARHILKRGFLPVLLLVVPVFLIFSSGYFDQTIGFYEERGAEDSGRFAVWPLVIERFLDSPLIGVDDVATYVPEMQKEITPHNSFLFVGLASGIIPLAFFVAYWIKAVKG